VDDKQDGQQGKPLVAAKQDTMGCGAPMSEQKVRMYGEDLSHPIYVWNGILEPKHRKKIGSALWEFLWCLNRITKEKDGIGSVLGGKPVTYEEMAEELGVSTKTIQRHMERLFREGYVDPVLTPRGYSLRVPNSCKFPKRVGQKCPTTQANGGLQATQTKVSTQVGQKCPTTQDRSVHPPDKSVLPNIRVSSLSKHLEEAVEEAAAAKTAPRALSTPSLKRESSEKEPATAAPVRRDMTEAEYQERIQLIQSQAQKLKGASHAAD
jgi:biotin operon repressor